ncbi:MAG: S9 family peptidase [Saprospiraceae bacterium]|nr:S9 family peptidase [Saprospiraceae bacterium]|tara:strand:- start:9995 stop:12202 length:2208 start_codon:yes stop_codon:yes gene_type:complete
MTKYITSLLVMMLIIATASVTAQKEISLEDIWTNYTFSPKRVPGFNFLNDGRHYTRKQSNVIKKYDLTTGDFVEDILDGATLGTDFTIGSYSFNSDESKIVIMNNRESIYRRSFKANYYVYDRATKQLSEVFDGDKISYGTLSPDDKQIAFVHNNNLYSKDLSSNVITAITTDGEYNKIVNGAADWVYEEEFAFAKAFFWSPDSKKIAFIRFDETEVKEFTMQMYNDEMYPENVVFKYPKVGEDNAKVSAHIYHIGAKGKTIEADLGNLDDMYIPRLKWTTDENELCAFKMNRHQNHLELYIVDAKNGSSTVMLDEKSKYYIDIHDNLTFLDNGKEFIWTSEKDGYNHIYLYGMDGKEKIALTAGDYDVTAFYGVDEKKKKVYFQAADRTPMEKRVFEIGYKGKKPRVLDMRSGTSNATFSSTYDYYILSNSTLNTPATYNVYTRGGELVRALEDNKILVGKQKEYGAVPAKFFEFTTSEDVKLNGWMMQPQNMQKGRKYPVLVTQYSGPNSQSVKDSWGGANYWWYQHLSQQGFIIVCVDPRGTGARGEEFRKQTYLELGKLETLDMIETAKWLGKLPNVDADNIGIFGWSYGGYMSSLAILKGNDVYQAAIAVAPVTSWKWYDTIYTERYMRTLAENESGYSDNSPIYFADKLKGDYLLIHGGGDDNVHFQHSAEMTRALIEANKQFDQYYYTNRNHGIYGDNARIHLYTKMTNFLTESLQSKNASNNDPIRP